MVPEQDHLIEVFGDEVLIFSTTQRTSVADERPEAGDTSPVLFALGAIVLSLIALLSFAKWNDTKLGRTKSKLAHFYVAPALLALAILTFYPVLYGFWLAFTDANQTQLGDQSFIGLDNFFEVFSAEGFLRVTLFTLVWTVVNVSAHIGIGLFLANMLHRSRIHGKFAYRTLLLLPWAVPSYISVLVWRGMFQPDGFVNDLLGTNIDFLSDPTGAQIIVILVNIWLGCSVHDDVHFRGLARPSKGHVRGGEDRRHRRLRPLPSPDLAQPAQRSGALVAARIHLDVQHVQRHLPDDRRWTEPRF